MKQTLFILALITSTIQTFAQSPRIKLNQITKDSVTGSVLISSPTDSGMVYSRDLFISYGVSDTVLILRGDTLAATSSIISSVLSDGVTITGDGTIGSELTVDTATVIATKQDLDLYYLDSNPDGYTSNAGTVTSVGGTGTVNGISLSGTVTSSGDLTLGGTLSGVDLASQVTGTLPIANGGTGETTLAGAGIVTGSGTTNYVPKFTNSTTVGNSVIYDDANNIRIGTTTHQLASNRKMTVLGTASIEAVSTGTGGEPTIEAWQKHTLGNNVFFDFFTESSATQRGQILYNRTNNALAINGNNALELRTGSNNRLFITSAGEVYIAGTSDQGAYNLQVNGTGVWGAGAYVNGSDILLKENIQPLNHGLKYIKKLNPVQYNYKSTFSSDQSKQLGFIAQDVMFALEDVSDAIVKDNGNYLSMAYQNLIPITVKAIQEQQAIIESQSNEIEQLKTLITDLSNRLQILENN